MSTKYLTGWLRKLIGKVPLRFLLLIPFMIIIITMGGLMSWFSWHNGQQLVSEVAYQLANEISGRIKKSLETHLQTLYTLNVANAEAIRFEQLDLDHTDSLEHYFWRQNQLFDVISYIAFATATGEFIGIERQPDDTFTIGEVKSSLGNNLYNYMADEQGRRSDLLSVVKDYDPREQAWYKSAKQATQPVWSPFYLRATSNNVALGIVQPIYETTGPLKGVLMVELSLLKITQFLNQLNISQSGISVIMERSGKMVTTSTQEEVFPVSSNRQEFRQLYAKNSANSLIQLTAHHLLSRFGDLNEIHTTTQMTFESDQQHYFLQVVPLVNNGINWLIVVVIPAADFSHFINQNTRLIFLSIAIGTITTLFLGTLLARWMTRPLQHLQAAILRLSRGEWEQKLPLGRPDELGKLLKLFVHMEKKLQRAFESLEQQADDCKHQLSKAHSYLTASQAHLVQSEKMALLGQKISDIIHAVYAPLTTIKNNIEMTQELFTTTRELVVSYDQLINGLLSQEAEIDKAYLQTQLQELAESNQRFYEEYTLQEIQTVFNKSLTEIDKISAFITNLEKFSQIEQASIMDIDLNECLDNILVITDNIFKHKITIHKHYTTLPKVHCSPSQINHVLFNLLTNAGQAIEYQGLIYIKTSMDDKFVHLAIQDNGKGISKELLPQIFEPFFTTKPFGQGTGLGLAVSHHIIQQHGGHIKVVSEVGKGTKVVVSLPYQIQN
ncbi:MAG: HAMP domain-containing protein [Thioploca sp.]|nr:HAMP domain-containing protein [Thioploca sp.]